jgi:hypothetical protein
MIATSAIGCSDSVWLAPDIDPNLATGHAAAFVLSCERTQVVNKIRLNHAVFFAGWRNMNDPSID